MRQYETAMSQVLDVPKTDQAAAHPPSTALTFTLSAAAGSIVANIYYAQPLIGQIAPSLGLPQYAASLLVTLTQLGYAAGLILLVPLGDMLENRTLIVRTVAATTLALALAAAAPDGPIFFIAAVLIGLTASSVQMIVPMAAFLAPAESRGRVVGNVMAGLILGILFARPLGSIIAYVAGWRAVFAIAALAMIGLTFVLNRGLPRHQPVLVPGPEQNYMAVLRSMPLLMLRERTLRRRSFYQAAAFGAFSLYWTAIPLLLTDEFHYTQLGIAIFALVGAAGAIAAPIAGRLADRGWGRPGTAVALLLVMASAGLSDWGATHHDVVLLALAGVVLDFGVQANVVFGQRAIYALASELRSRLNGAYMATFFLGGAMASAAASWLLIHGGWNAVALTGAALPALALVYFISTFIGSSFIRQQRPG
jgi:predicted MFS family arabinose efflux permease